MEVEYATEIYERSSERNVRYLHYLGDGDSRANKEVKQLRFYGDEIPAETFKYRTHMQKWMGPCLQR